MIISFIIYIVLVVYGCVFSVLYNEYQVLIMVVTIASIPVISLVVNAITMLFLTAEVRCEKQTVYKTDEIEFEIVITNKGILPISSARVRITYGLYHSKKREKKWIPFSIRARSEQVIRIKLKCEHAGYLMVTCNRIQVYDFFKVFKVSKRSKASERVLVYPDVKMIPLEVDEQRLYGNEEEDGFEQDMPGDDPSQVFDFREYREGDKLQRVHWKLSSKKNELIVREFSKPIIIHTGVLIDFCENKKTTGEGISDILERASAVCYTLLQRKIRFYVMWFCSANGKFERYFVDSEENFYLLISSLANEKATNDKDILLNEYLSINDKYPNLFYIGTRTQEELDCVKAEVV